MKKFIVVLIAAIIFNITVAHAAEVDPYFEWDIKNLDAYRQHDLIFSTTNPNGIIGLRDLWYKIINVGEYSLPAKGCDAIDVYHKIAFGADYFDAGFTEFNAKLCLAADELDAAERKIDLLTVNAADNLSRIRALNLQADLLNRREKFSEALQSAQTADELLKTLPDEKLRLLNQMHMARAYCGLGNTQQAVRIFNKICQPLEDTFGKYGAPTFSMMSLGAELAHKTQHDDIAKNWLLHKCNLAYEIYEQTNRSAAAADSRVELATFYFDIGDTEKATEVLNNALAFTEALHNESSGTLPARRLYKDISSIATKYLGENHQITLCAEFGFVYVNADVFGDIPQAITFYEQNLPKFKKIFGENNVDTLDMMEDLKDSYLALGRYADAKKIAEQSLHICRKHFKDHASRTIYSTIQLAEIYYRMGKYKTADKLLADLQARNSKLFEKNSPPDFVYQTLFKKAEGARLRGDISGYAENLRTLDNLLRKHDPQYKDNALFSSYGFNMILAASKLSAMTELAHNTGTFERLISNGMNIFGVNYNPLNLNLKSDIAEFHAKYGNLTEANRYANQVLKLSRRHLSRNNVIECRGLNTLSKIRRAEGKFSDAFNLDNKALQIAETVCGKNSLERLQTLDALASDYSATGNLAEAIKIREHTLNDYKKILEDTDAATVQMMTNLAENYVAAGRYADAVKLCDETLAAQKNPVYTNDHLSFYPSVTELIRIKAQAQKFSGDNADAYKNYVNLIRAYEAERIANSYISSAMSGGENRAQWFAGKVPAYKNAATVAAEIADANFAFYCTELCKGRSLIDRFDDVLVTKNYLLTADEKNTLAKYENILQAAQTLGENAAAANDDALALNAELAYENLRIFAEIFRSDLREKYSDNMIPKNSQNRNDRTINFSLIDQLDLSIWDQSSIWDWNELLKNFDVQKNRAAIPDDACLVEFMKTADDSLLVTFLRNEGDLQAVNIPVAKNFFETCRLYHDLNAYADLDAMNRDSKFLWRNGDNYVISADRTSKPDNSEPVKDNATFIALRNRLAADLSAQLMPTLEKFAGSSKHWIISPDVELNIVPFETLTYRGKLLIENKNVSYVPSLAVMNLMKNRERKNAYLSRSKELFAMGDAVYGGNNSVTSRQSRQKFFSSLRSGRDVKLDIKALRWEDLSGTARELDKVAPLFDSKEILRREQVTEKNLRQLNASGELSKYKYLLFAAHGMFVPERPEYSAIVLSQGLNDADSDGYVTVGEWMSYDLRSNLIYLSACESGLGDYRAGEGIIGIPYALTVAGNKDTVMSLWKVDDAATAEFTAAVFEKLSRGQSEVTALNDTKREFLSKPAYNSPSIWAAFMLYGI